MKYRVIWNQGVARRTAPHTGRPGVDTFTGLVYNFMQEVEVVRDNIPDENDPTNPNKRWVEFVERLPNGKPLFGASHYPNNAGVPSVRMEKIEGGSDKPCKDETFTLTVQGYKPFTGILECEDEGV